MKIAAIDVLEYARPLDGRSWNPQTRWTERRAPLLVIQADDGATGVGEAWCRQPAIGAILAHLSDAVGPWLAGREVNDAAAIARISGELRSMPAAADEAWVAAAAASAVDIALWDLLARSRQQPLWRALGGASGRVHVYASGGLYRDGEGTAELAAAMRGYVESGFQAVKMKIGALALESDLERVRAVRAAIGPGAELWVDAVNRLDGTTALPWAHAMAAAGATAIQAPVPFADLATMAAINADCLPVVAGEAVHDQAGFDLLLAADAVTLLQPCLGLCGGFTGATAAAARARVRLIGSTAQTFGTAVLQAAALHWGAATVGAHSVEYHRFHDHLAALLPPCMSEVVAGTVAPGERPGLGVAVPQPGPQHDGAAIRLHRSISNCH